MGKPIGRAQTLRGDLKGISAVLFTICTQIKLEMGRVKERSEGCVDGGLVIPLPS